MKMTSLEIAQLTGKDHKNVLRDINAMLNEINASGGQLKIEPSYYFNEQNKKQPMYELDYRDTFTLVTGYSITLRRAVIDRWHELEKKEKEGGFYIPKTLSEALWLAADLQAQIELDKPKVEFVDKYVESTDLRTFREVAKLLNTNERDFRKWLVDNKWQYLLNGRYCASSYVISSGYMKSKAGLSGVNGHSFVQWFFTTLGISKLSETMVDNTNKVAKIRIN